MSETEPRDGLLLVDKEAGCTSHDVVRSARRLYRQRKIGHCGTLDPAATGLLVLTLGKATRLTRFLISAPKVYSGTIRFGRSTDTYDATGQVVEERPTDGLTPERITTEMAAMVGTFEQQTPPFSAKKVGGVKYYELARRGEEVPESSKEITVFELTALSPPTSERLEFRLACSSGTYVRSIAHELGERLGCGGHLESLARQRVGPFELDSALTLAALEERCEAGEGPGDAWVPFDRIPLPFGGVVADSQQERRIVHGQTVLLRDLEGDEGDWIKLSNRRQQLIAVGTVIERIGESGVGVVQPRIVFRG